MFKLKLRGKDVFTKKPIGSIVNLHSYGSNLNSPIFMADGCIVPDKTDGIYAMVKDKTYFASKGSPYIIPSAEEYSTDIGVSYVLYSSNGESYDIWNKAGGNQVKVLVGKNTNDLVEIPLYQGIRRYLSGSEHVYGSDSTFNNASINTNLKNTLIDAGFSEESANVLAIGGSVIAYNTYYYVRFRGYIREPFIFDISDNGVPLKIYKKDVFNNHPGSSVGLVSTLIDKYGTLAKNPPVVLGIYAKPGENVNYVYLKNTTDFAVDSTTEMIKNELISIGIDSATADILSKGVDIKLERVKFNNGSNYELTAKYKFSNMSTHKTFPTVSRLSVLNTNVYYKICVGDRNYLNACK